MYYQLKNVKTLKCRLYPKKLVLRKIIEMTNDQVIDSALKNYNHAPY